MSLKEQLHKVTGFFKPENLERTDLAYAPAEGDIQLVSDIALLVIDVQKEFCDPRKSRGNEETEEVAQKISTIVPAFRKAGVPTYAIYFSEKAKKPHKIDFYKFKPEAGDILIRKNQDSAFQGSKIDDVLKQAGRKTLLACGFNLNACVYSTVMDARRKDYDVCLIRDLTGNDNNNIRSRADYYLERMKENGIRILTTEEALQEVAAKRRNVYKPAA